MMKVCGIDYSMTSPALCVHIGDRWHFNNCKFFYRTSIKKLACKMLNGQCTGTLNDKKYKSQEERFDEISYWAMKYCLGCDMVSIENYAFAATGRVFDVAENTGLLKHKLWVSNTPFTVVSPPVVKKFATDSGAATKTKMHEAWIKETGINLHEEMTPKRENVGNPVSDVVDAYYICKHLFFNYPS